MHNIVMENTEYYITFTDKHVEQELHSRLCSRPDKQM